MRDLQNLSARLRLGALFAAALLVAAISPGSPATARDQGAAAGRPAPAAAAPVAVTLVTGDRVVLRDETGGKRSVMFEPAEGRDEIDAAPG